MNCDFVEGEYFYNQSESQGEIQLDKPTDDSLDWLPSYTPNHTSSLREINSGGEACRDSCEENQLPSPSPSQTIEVDTPEQNDDNNETPIPTIQNEALSDIQHLPDPLLDPEVTGSDSIPQDSMIIVTNMRQE